DTNVKNNTYYNYSVAAVKDGAEAELSAVVLTRHFDAPATVKASNGVKGVNVTWSAVEGALSYDIYVRAAGQADYQLVFSGAKANSTFVHADAKTGVYYKYAVVARCGKYAGELNVNGPLVKCVQAPVLVSATNGVNGVVVKWNAVEGATGYRVYSRVGGSSTYLYLGTVTTNTYTDTKAASGKYYKYVVKAVHGSTQSNYDANGKVLKYVQTPKLLGIANGTDGIYVKWQLVGGADKYNIYRRGAGEGYKLIATVKASSVNNYKDTTVVACQYYRYTVRAISGGIYSNYNANGLMLRFMPLNGTWNKAVTYNFYKNAVGMVKNNGAAGYNLKAWQDVKGITVKSSDSALSSALKDEFNKLFGEVTSLALAKGSADAKDCFPANNVAYNQVKSATCTKKGNNYVIKVVFVDTKNPAGNNNAITKTAPIYVDMAAMADAMYDGDYITKATGSATYTSYTVTSEITPDGKFVSMTHSGPCKATLDLYGSDLGTIDIDMSLVFNAKYTGFQY
ncbi:MAG: hypothetical protein J6Q83_05570, partial [Clostridia bacterium]|nr:hypothetical protein [Clostridia bacterium]